MTCESKRDFVLNNQIASEAKGIEIFSARYMRSELFKLLSPVWNYFTLRSHLVLMAKNEVIFTSRFQDQIFV